MTAPKFEVKVGKYKLVSWENTHETFGKTLSYSLTKSTKKADGTWLNQTINVGSLNEVRVLTTALQEMVIKSSTLSKEMTNQTPTTQTTTQTQTKTTEAPVEVVRV